MGILDSLEIVDSLEILDSLEVYANLEIIWIYFLRLDANKVFE